MAYEELIVALAKHLYREKHPERKRVVRGFAEGFHLHLYKTEEGSTIPKIVLAPTLALLSLLPSEITEARKQLELYSTIFEPEDFIEKSISFDAPDCWISVFAEIKNRINQA